MAETSPVFRAIITAVDKATAVMDRIGGRAKKLGGELGHLSNPWGKATGEISVFTRASNVAHIAAMKLRNIGAPFEHAREPVHQLTEGVHRLGEKIKGVGEKVSELVPMLGGLGAAAGLAGMFELVHKVAESFSQLAHSSAMLGISTEAMQKLAYAAKMTDTPLDSLQTGLFRANRAIADAAAGKNKDAAALFHHLGISLHDASGHMVDAASILPKLQEAFGKTADPAMRARMAMALFGRGGKEMLPFLQASKEEMTAWSEQASRLVYPFSGEDKENLEGFKRGWIGMETAIGGFMDEVAAKLAPILTPVIDKFTDWVAANRDWIATDIGGAVDKLAKFIMRIDFTQVVKDTEAWGHWIGHVADKILGLKGTIILLTALMAAPWVAAAGGFIMTLGKIAIAAGKAAWAIGKGLTGAIRAASGAAAASNAAAAGAEFGSLIAGTGGAATAAGGATLSSLALPAVIAAVGAYFGFKGAEATGTKVGAAAHAGLTPDKMDEFNNPIGYRDASGHYYTNDEADKLGAGHDAPAPSVIPDASRAIAGRSGGDGKVDVNVTFNGTPPGTDVTAKGSGVTSEPQTDVGYAFPGFAFVQ